MTVKRFTAAIVMTAALLMCPGVHAQEVFKVQLFFGLSIPGGGAVSLVEWEDFRDKQIATAFEGFNVMDTVGFYKGAPERSKVLTILLAEDEMHKAVELAASFAARFHQESVMMVKLPVLSWQFIKASPSHSREKKKKKQKASP